MKKLHKSLLVVCSITADPRTSAKQAADAPSKATGRSFGIWPARGPPAGCLPKSPIKTFGERMPAEGLANDLWMQRWPRRASRRLISSISKRLRPCMGIVCDHDQVIRPVQLRTAHHRLAVLRVQVPVWLVGEQDQRIAGHRPRHRHGAAGWPPRAPGMCRARVAHAHAVSARPRPALRSAGGMPR